MRFWEQVKQAFRRGNQEAHIDAFNIGDRGAQDRLKRELTISELKSMIIDRAGCSDHVVKLKFFEFLGLKPTEQERHEVLAWMQHSRPQLFSRLPDSIDEALVNASWQSRMRPQ